MGCSSEDVPAQTDNVTSASTLLSEIDVLKDENSKLVIESVELSEQLNVKTKEYAELKASSTIVRKDYSLVLVEAANLRVQNQQLLSVGNSFTILRNRHTVLQQTSEGQRLQILSGNITITTLQSQLAAANVTITSLRSQLISANLTPLN